LIAATLLIENYSILVSNFVKPLFTPIIAGFPGSAVVSTASVGVPPTESFSRNQPTGWVNPHCANESGVATHNPKSSPNAVNLMALGAHAPSRVAVGAPAGRFFSNELTPSPLNFAVFSAVGATSL
jgi:hypothetical protein